MDDAEFFGVYPGCDLDRDAWEALLHTRWAEKERRQEAGLFTSKWWDVRILHPVAATYLFAHIFAEQSRTIIRAHIDDAPSRTAGNGAVIDWQPIKAGDVFEPPKSNARMAYWQRKTLGLIRARQAADRDGIPYDHFIREGLKHFYFGAGSYVLARSTSSNKVVEINLLYGADCLARIRETWLEQVQIRVKAAKHPRYLLVNDDGHADHAAHRAWLEQQLSLRAAPELARARLVAEGLL